MALAPLVVGTEQAEALFTPRPVQPTVEESAIHQTTRILSVYGGLLNHAQPH